MIKLSDKALVQVRDEILKRAGLPVLAGAGFRLSPFSHAWNGSDNMGGCSYELCRVSDVGYLEIINIYIASGDKRIQVHLNIFNPQPAIDDAGQLNGLDGIAYLVQPNVKTRLCISTNNEGFFKGRQVFQLNTGGLFKSLESEKEKLAESLKSEFSRINKYIERWLSVNGEPASTDWNGNQI
ncbi:hypothetical protein HC752_04900 [Vibrio sp. S9_S30]|uniref:hypothetical protein n=1 Tax=Vibrio sp. S9_S30 TaxID=2720226 RepID=UPI001680BB69|nr:hypothetical protein [Vibrio sp. S9_S30]MBD1556268.1 hypothetical protein [Vibrio sp. S9_S30]